MSVRVRVEDFEKYIELIPRRLGFGCAPRGTHVDELTINRGVNVIVNIRQTHPKFNVLWYKSQTKAEVLHIPLELKEDEDGGVGDTLQDDKKLTEQARMVASILLKDDKKHIYIHGYDAYNYTSVFALLVWTFAQPKIATFDPLKEFEKLYGRDMTCDYPSSAALRKQLTDVIQMSRKDIFSAFARGSSTTKRLKHEQQQHQDGASSGSGDIHSQPPGATPGDSGHDAAIAGRVGKGPQEGV
jgi:hypothetical protein